MILAADGSVKISCEIQSKEHIRIVLVSTLLDVIRRDRDIELIFSVY